MTLKKSVSIPDVHRLNSFRISMMHNSSPEAAMRMMRKPIPPAVLIATCVAIIMACGGGGGGDTYTVIAAPGLTLSASSGEFNGVVVNNSSDRQFTITSTGTRTLRITTITSNNANMSIPAGYDTCSGQSLSVGASCTFITRFTPTSEGSQNGTIAIAGDVPATIALHGQGYGLNVWINQIVSASCGSVVVDVTVNNPADPSAMFAQANFASPLGSISQNGALQTITVFSPRDPDSASVVLALDLSASVYAAIPDIKAAAKYFVGRMTDNDEAAVFKFGSTIIAYPDTAGAFIPTDAAGQTDLNARIDAPDPGTTATELYDAVYEAVTRAMAGVKSTKAVVVLSDGFNESTSRSLAEVIQYAKDNKIPVFTIYYVDTSYPAGGRPAIMQQLAEETGGQDFYADTTTMQEIFTQIWSALTKKYRITYVPTSCTSGSQSLQISVGAGSVSGVDTDAIIFP